MWATILLILGAASIHLCRMEMYAKYTEKLAEEVEAGLAGIKSKNAIATTTVVESGTVVVDSGLGDETFGV